VKLTIVLFVLILLPSIVGTVVQQNASDPSEYLEIYGSFWHRIFGFLGFYDIYHDPRFIILLVMLGLNTLACTINRLRPRWNIAGMLLTHVGLLLILAGALVGATMGVKGFMAIREGETLDQIRISGSNDQFKTIPFNIKLLDFILDMHEEPSHRLYTVDIKSGEQSSRKVSMGSDVSLSESRWAGVMALFGIKPKVVASVQVEGFIRNATMTTSLSEGPELTGVKAVEIALRGHGGERRAFAVSGADRPYQPRGTHMGIFYSKLDSAGDVEAEIEKAVASTLEPSRLEVIVDGSALDETFPVEVGSKFEIEGYTVEVLKFVADFIIGDGGVVTSRSDFPHNPAVKVKTTDPAGESFEQWLFAKHPAMHTPENPPPFELKYVREGRDDHVVDQVFIVSAPDSTPVAVYARGGKLVTRGEIASGESLGLGNTGFELVIIAMYEDANINRDMKELPEGAPGGRAALEIVINHGSSKEERVLWEDEPFDIPGYRLVYGQDKRVRDFFSVLQVIDGEEVVLEKKIEVNDPLRYGGYTFYQSSYDQKGLSWSGLQVRNDPGVPLVYAGFLIQILGMIVIFYINPLLRKSKKA
jgi:hypothetical protein